MQVVAAKFTAAYVFYAVMWLPLLACLLLVSHFASQTGGLDAGMLGGMYLAFCWPARCFFPLAVWPRLPPAARWWRPWFHWLSASASLPWPIGPNPCLCRIPAIATVVLRRIVLTKPPILRAGRWTHEPSFFRTRAPLFCSCF